MKTTLFCFSTSGNSYAVATYLAKEFGDTTIVLLPTEGEISVTERVGIIMPVWNGYPPQPVTDFVRNRLATIDLTSMQYLFCIHTYGKRAGKAPLMLELCLQEIGCLSSYQNTIRMPYAAKGEEFRPMDEERLSDIIKAIKEEKMRLSFKTPFAKTCFRHLMDISQRANQGTREDFSLGDGCTGCGICISSCPTGSIVMEGGKPLFPESCIGCKACALSCSGHLLSFGSLKSEKCYPLDRDGLLEERKRQQHG